jgi:hypothetical protein
VVGLRAGAGDLIVAQTAGVTSMFSRIRRTLVTAAVTVALAAFALPA